MDTFLARRPQPHHGRALLPGIYDRLFEQGGAQFFDDCDVTCRFADPRGQDSRFYDLRKGIMLNRDRLAMQPGANYKLETVFKDTRFEYEMTCPDNWSATQKAQAAAVIDELIGGRAWFGASKNKGLGRIRLELDEASESLLAQWRKSAVNPREGASSLEITLRFGGRDPLLVGWPFDDAKERDEQGNVQSNFASWSKDETQERKKHIEVKRKIQRREYRDWNDVPDWFRQAHSQTRGLNQLAQLDSSIANDENLIAFYKWFIPEAKKEYDSHKDYRTKDGSSYTEGNPYDRQFVRMLRWKRPEQPADGETWELYIPGSTLKGAFRGRTARLLQTLRQRDHRFTGDTGGQIAGVNRELQDIDSGIAVLFGTQGDAGRLHFSDAHLVGNGSREERLSSLDSIKIDPKTGKPEPKHKIDYLFAQGDGFVFEFTLYLEMSDVNHNAVMKCIAWIAHLIKDFRAGEIPIGGNKTVGFGWGGGWIHRIEARQIGDAGGGLIGALGLQGTRDEVWNTATVDAQSAQGHNSRPDDKGAWEALCKLGDRGQHYIQESIVRQANPLGMPTWEDNGRERISHRRYAGHCGRFTCQLTVLTPLHIKESGEPTVNSGDRAPAWDFFHFGPPEQAKKGDDFARCYAIPGPTLKGNLRHLYNALTNGQADPLFGYSDGETGYMGRVAIGFARHESGDFAWYAVPITYPHPEYHCNQLRFYPNMDPLDIRNASFDGQGPHDLWQSHARQVAKLGADKVDLIPPTAVAGQKQGHLPLRCAEPDSTFNFEVRFWNLRDDELDLLKRCLTSAELQLTARHGQDTSTITQHALGKGKALGLGRCEIAITKEQYIDWPARYGGASTAELGTKDTPVQPSPSSSAASERTARPQSADRSLHSHASGSQQRGRQQGGTRPTARQTASPQSSFKRGEQYTATLSGMGTKGGRGVPRGTIKVADGSTRSCFLSGVDGYPQDVAEKPRWLEDNKGKEAIVTVENVPATANDDVPVKWVKWKE
jgi:CRISPR/Cas system CSM-associated protein Csm3 (group 7 of RAMP superfamily)